MAKKITTRGNYFSSHNSGVMFRIDASKAQLKPGMVVAIDYRATYRVAKKMSLYIVVDPNYEGFLHVVDLDYIKPSEFISYLKYSIEKTPIITKIGKWDIPMFNFRAKGDALYRQLTAGITEDCYRKLSVTKIRYLRVCIMSNLLGLIPKEGETSVDKRKKEEELKKANSDVPKTTSTSTNEGKESLNLMMDQLNKDMINIINGTR